MSSPAKRMCAATLALPPGHVFRQLLSAGHTPGDLMNALPHLEHDPGSSSLLAMERSSAGARVLCWAGWGQFPWHREHRKAGSECIPRCIPIQGVLGIPGEGSAGQHRAVPDPLWVGADGQEGYPGLSAAPSASPRIRSGKNSKEQCRTHMFTGL